MFRGAIPTGLFLMIFGIGLPMAVPPPFGVEEEKALTRGEPSIDPDLLLAEEDERHYPMDRVIRKVVEKLQRIPTKRTDALARLFQTMRNRFQSGESLPEAASNAVGGDPEAARFLREDPRARSSYDSEKTDCTRNERTARTKRDEARARQQLRALMALGRALGWE